MTEQLSIVDVDGSYVYRKQQQLIERGYSVAALIPPPPPSGWDAICKENVQELRCNIPAVTSGMYNFTAYCY